MGNVARIGIVGGRKVPINGVRRVNGRGDLNSFSKNILKHYRFDEVADKILSDFPLDVSDIARLLTEAPFPLLLKLIELRCCPPVRKAPTPVVLLPLASWCRQFDDASVLSLASNFLRNVSQKEVCVVFDELDFLALEGRLGELIKEILICRPGLSLIAPSAEEIVSWIVMREGSSASAVQVVKLVRILGQLKRAGFSHLSPTMNLEYMKLVKQAGFSTCLTTCVDQFDVFEDLAQELSQIRELSGPADIVDLWGPGVSGCGRTSMSYASVDVILLHTLAVGALCLDRAVAIRASSSYFSLEAMTFAPHCGANDFGMGAADLGAAAYFNLQPLETLQELTSIF
ncbi:hypothetical protein OAO01_02250 [Oligoflexia bacterium]|nr:hypothetical protein [Oligoflexia bacterium]